MILGHRLRNDEGGVASASSQDGSETLTTQHLKNEGPKPRRSSIYGSAQPRTSVCVSCHRYRASGFITRQVKPCAHSTAWSWYATRWMRLLLH